MAVNSNYPTGIYRISQKEFGKSVHDSSLRSLQKPCNVLNVKFLCTKTTTKEDEDQLGSFIN